MRRAVLGLLMLLTVGLVAAVTVTTDETSQPPAPTAAQLAPGATTGAQFARAACVRIRLVEQGVQANASAEGVRRTLGEARLLAAEAARRDPRWLGLSGGVAALDEAVLRDDGTAASIGLRAARASCRPG